jgi:hypothetical protein
MAKATFPHCENELRSRDVSAIEPRLHSKTICDTTIISLVYRASFFGKLSLGLILTKPKADVWSVKIMTNLNNSAINKPIVRAMLKIYHQFSQFI